VVAHIYNSSYLGDINKIEVQAGLGKNLRTTPQLKKNLGDSMGPLRRKAKHREERGLRRRRSGVFP
jgi:hypothetical protein